MEGTVSAAASEREWWLRALAVVVAPRPVFAAIRDDSRQAAEARQEPVAAIVLLAGAAGVLSTSVAHELLDDVSYDALLVVVWTVVAGAVYALGGYFLVGFLVYLGASFAGALGSYRRARHLLAYAAVPLALSLGLQLLRIALFGGDALRSGGADTGAPNDVFAALETAALLWSLALLAVGIRVVHGWSWPRTAAAAALPAALLALVLARAYGLA